MQAKRRRGNGLRNNLVKKNKGARKAVGQWKRATASATACTPLALQESTIRFIRDHDRLSCRCKLTFRNYYASIADHDTPAHLKLCKLTDLKITVSSQLLLLEEEKKIEAGLLHDLARVDRAKACTPLA